jgi:hypothetical protein
MGLMKSFVDSVEEFKEFKAFVESKPACQHECFKKVFPESVETLIGKVGDDIVKPDAQQVAIQAFTGAFRTCFPSPPRDTVKEAMQKITDSMGSHDDMKPVKIKSKGTCPGTKGMGDKASFMAKAMPKIGIAMNKVVAKHDDIKDFFENTMMVCQGSCLGEAIAQAINVNWDMGTLEDEDKMTASIEGAIKSCLPGVPYKDVKAYVQEVKETVQDETDDRLRLYQTGPILDPEAGQKSGMMTLIAAVGGVFALALGIFAAGLRVGKKIRQRQQADADARLVEFADIE